MSTLPAPLVVAALLLGASLVRVRGRPLARWWWPAVGFLSRTRAVAADAGVDGLLAAAWPGSRLVHTHLDGAPVGMVADRWGAVAVLVRDDPGWDGAPPDDLHPLSDPPVQVLRHEVAAAGTGRAGASYRELAGDGTVLTRWVLLAVRVPPGADPPAVVRAVRDRLAPATLRPLAPAELADTLRWLAGGPPVREDWSGLVTAGGRQVCFRLGPSDPVATPPGALAVTVSATRHGRLLRVTLPSPGSAGAPRGSGGPPPGGPGTGSAVGGPVTGRLDGEHLPGLAATLPLAATAPPVPPADHGPREALRAATPGPDDAGHDDPGHDDPGHARAGPGRRPGDPTPTGVIATPSAAPPAGLVVGRDRAGRPVMLDLFGPRGARVLLAGGPAAAVLLAWRALGAGARVVVHTARPHVWSPLVDTADSPLGIAGLTVVAAGDAAPVPTALWQTLHLWDGGAGPATPPGHRTAHIVVRDRLTGTDAEPLARADAVLTGPLTAREAAVVSAARGLGTRGAALRPGASGPTGLDGGAAAPGPSADPAAWPAGGWLITSHAVEPLLASPTDVERWLLRHLRRS